VGNIENNPTLAEVTDDFLSHLTAEERGKTQAEIFKFVRWLGASRQVKDISPVDVASYGEQIIPSAAKPLKSFLTKLEKELASLRNQHSRVIEEIQRAAADKDFRENAPLAAAREQKAHLDGRIKELEATLNQAKIMGEDQDTSRVKFGDTVVLRDLSSGKEFSYTLVDPREANPAQGKLSVASPLGKAIVDKEKGQTVEVVAPAGTFCCSIEDILVLSKKEQ